MVLRYQPLRQTEGADMQTQPLSRCSEAGEAVCLRKMTAADREAVMAIVKAAPEFRTAEAAVAEEVLDSYLAGGALSGYHMQVALAGERIAGYICFGQTPLTEGTWDVYWIAVADMYRGRGIGTTLMQFAEKEISTSHGRMILVETSTRADYAATRQFYRRLGYVPVAEIPDFYTCGDGRLTLQKLIHSAEVRKNNGELITQ
jgi:ribosomal protein S18 acetylase RimI-like enzyme